MTSRREFLRLGAAVGVSAFVPTVPFRGRSRKILVLGGTSFIGPHQVQYALDRGHEVTLFNRGRTNSDLFPGVEKLIGDRNSQLDALRGRRWDVVIDNSATDPEWVRQSAALLKDTVDRYVYVSSRSAYQHFRRIPMTADAPTFTFESAGVDPSTPGARRRHRRRADHRRARSVRVDGAPGRGRHEGHVQCRRSLLGAVVRRIPARHPCGHDRRDALRMGRHRPGHPGIPLFETARATGGPQGGHEGGKGSRAPGRVAGITGRVGGSSRSMCHVVRNGRDLKLVEA